MILVVNLLFWNQVSSFETAAKNGKEKQKTIFSQMPPGCDKKDFVRWRDSMRRDFTINRLLLIFFAYNVLGYGEKLWWIGLWSSGFRIMRNLFSPHAADVSISLEWILIYVIWTLLSFFGSTWLMKIIFLKLLKQFILWPLCE